MKRVAGLFISVAASLWLSGCSGGKHLDGCTLIGCSSAVSVDMHGVAKAFPGARSMNVCVDNHCYLAFPIERQLGGSPYRPRRISYESPAINGEGPYTVRVEVKDRHGHVLLRREARGVKLTRRYPNGKGCGDPCFSAGLALNFATRELERETNLPNAPSMG